MSDDKVTVVRYEPALISEEDCEPRIGFIPFQDGDWVSFADYEAAIARAEAAERDAARYRWLRSVGSEPWIGEDGTTEYPTLDAACDAAIDAAIAAQQTEN